MNDKGDFELFVASRSTVLLRTAYLLCAGDRGAAEDLLQDVLERMYPKWRRLKGNPEAYARVALANASANRWRAKSRRVRETRLTAAPAPAIGGPEQDVVERDAMVRALGELPERMRAVIVLRFFDDLSEADTARALGCSAGTVKSQTSRGLKQPTRGDLAEDTEFTTAATRAWERTLPDDRFGGADVGQKVVGRPHVYWAGTTPAGKTAVVMQASEGWGTGKQETLRGVVGVNPATGAQELLAFAVFSSVSGDPYKLAYRFGPGSRTVLAFELATPQYLSAKVTYSSNEAGPRREWQPMRPKDGMVLGELPDGIAATDTRLVATDDLGRVNETLGDAEVTIVTGPGMADGGAARPYNGLPWAAPDDRSHPMSAGTEPPGWQDPAVSNARFFPILKVSPLLDRTTNLYDTQGKWYLSIGLPDGKIATISEYQAPYDPQARVYCVITEPGRPLGVVSTMGPADRNSPLPVLMKLGGQYGWAAASKGATLSYRTTVDGQWQGERAEALLAPVGTVQIQVKLPGRQPAIVDVK